MQRIVSMWHPPMALPVESPTNVCDVLWTIAQWPAPADLWD